MLQKLAAIVKNVNPKDGQTAEEAHLSLISDGGCQPQYIRIVLLSNVKGENDSSLSVWEN